MTIHRKIETEYSWERQPKESTQAYVAFCVYRDLPYGEEPEKRSILKTGKKLPKNQTTLKKWCSEWNWVDRCRDYDNDLQRRKFEAVKVRLQEAQERQLNGYKKIAERALEALASKADEDFNVRNILDCFAQSSEAERRILLEQLASSAPGGGIVTGNGKNAVIIPDMDEVKESPMEQLARTLREAYEADKE